MLKKLAPRLNYKFTVRDATIGISSLLKQKKSDALYKLFENEDIHFINHARTGLRIALSSLELPEKSRIGVQVYNCHTVFRAIQEAGFTPVFLDINEHFQLEAEDLKRKIKHIDALIVTHLFGIPAEFKRIKELAKKIPVIEDCAHSYISKYKNSYTGQFGDISIFSIGKAKFPTIGDGGFIVVNNLKYSQAIKKEIAQLPGQTYLKEVVQVLKGLLLSLAHYPIIYGSIVDRYLKKIYDEKDLSGKFKHEESKYFKVNRGIFLQGLNDHFLKKEKQRKNVQHFIKCNESQSSILDDIYNSKEMNWNCFMIPLLVNENRDVLIEILRDKGIEVGRHFSNSINWAKSYGYVAGDCLNSERISETILTIPSNYNYDYHLYEEISTQLINETID